MEISKPNLNIRNNFISSTKKYEIIRMAQENQHMLKRINERGSFYNVSKWEKDYERSQYYKRNHCIYPSIDFYKTQRLFTQASKPQKTSYSVGKKYRTFGDFNAEDFDGVKNLQSEQKRKENEEIKKNKGDDDKKAPKKLYETQSYIGDLGNCNVEFYVQTQNFNIKIESNDYPEKAYECIFDSRESIEGIQKYYRKYDEIITDINYDSENDIIIFNNDNKPELKCVRILFNLFFRNVIKLEGRNMRKKKKLKEMKKKMLKIMKVKKKRKKKMVVKIWKNIKKRKKKKKIIGRKIMILVMKMI